MTSYIGKITPIPSKAYTEKPKDSAQFELLIIIIWYQFSYDIVLPEGDRVSFGPSWLILFEP